MTQIDVIDADWPAPKHVRAISTTRLGGVSQGEFASLNLGAHVGDYATSVDLNRAALSDYLGLKRQPVWLNQTHGTDVVTLDGAAEKHNKEPMKADASITEEAKLPCVVMTADCLPILLTNKQGSQVAAVHAGWRGLANGVIEAAVRSFTVEPSHIMAWCGPCIGPSAFEVGVELKAQIGGPDDAYLSHDDDAKLYVDLQGLAMHRLMKLGVNECHASAQCTYSDPERFFSYRRDGQTGRMASLIWLEN